MSRRCTPRRDYDDEKRIHLELWLEEIDEQVEWLQDQIELDDDRGAVVAVGLEADSAEAEEDAFAERIERMFDAEFEAIDREEARGE